MDKLKDLEQLVNALQAQPEMLQLPQLAFFRKYLESLGATIPTAKKAEAHAHDHDHAKAGNEHEHQHSGGCCGGGHEHNHQGNEHNHGHPSGEAGPESDDEPEDEPEPPEEEDKDLMTPDADAPVEMGPDSAPELSDADQDKVGEKKMAAAEAASNGEYAKAIEAFTAAVLLAPSPLTYAKRAECFLKLKKPNAVRTGPPPPPPFLPRGCQRLALTTRLPPYERLAGNP